MYDYGCEEIKALNEELIEVKKKLQERRINALEKFLKENKLKGDVIDLYTGERGIICIINGGLRWQKYKKNGDLGKWRSEIYSNHFLTERFKGVSEMTREDWDKIGAYWLKTTGKKRG